MRGWAVCVCKTIKRYTYSNKNYRGLYTGWKDGISPQFLHKWLFKTCFYLWYNNNRSLFPTLLVSLHGLNPKKKYSISVKVSPVDNYRYKYINMKWCPVGDSDVIQNVERQIFHHPSSPNTGHFWMKRSICFKSIKITHHRKSKYGNVRCNVQNHLQRVWLTCNKLVPTWC